MNLKKETTIQLSVIEKTVLKELDDTLAEFCQNEDPDCENCPFHSEANGSCIKENFLSALNKITNYKA